MEKLESTIYGWMIELVIIGLKVNLAKMIVMVIKTERISNQLAIKDDLCWQYDVGFVEIE